MAKSQKLRPRSKSEENGTFDFESYIEKQEQEAFAEALTLHEPSALVDGEESSWVKLQGATPLEFLTMIYKNPWQKTSDRIAAAKAALDYVHKKLPQKIEVKGEVNSTQKINADTLTKLTDEELEIFMKLLSKLEGI